MKKVNTKIRLAILASGSGSNADAFIDYFKNHPIIDVALIVSNNPAAFVLDRAKKVGIPSRVIVSDKWPDQEYVEKIFFEYRIDAVVLAGYLRLVPAYFLQMFPGRIFNIHPALLPGFGGKGMYGSHVHEAVIREGEKQSGLTIHLVDEEYDKGHMLFQCKTEVVPGETPDSLAAKVLKLEHYHYPRVVEKVLLER